MKLRVNRLLLQFAIGLTFTFIINNFSSCTPAKNIKYFEDLTDSAVIRLPQIAKPEIVLMKDDILDIKILGANEATTALFNSFSSLGASSTGASSATAGYLIDNNGDVEFPIIGKVKAEGLTKEQFKEQLKSKLSKYLKDLMVSVKLANFRFTVLGEVKAPGNYSVVNEKVTILEALGYAGDMTQFALKSNVRVIREINGKTEIGLVNFNQKAVFTSAYFYLHPHDVVYVEPERKNNLDDVTRYTSIIATVVSLLAVTLTLFR